jgi:hypothetical protein
MRAEHVFLAQMLLSLMVYSIMAAWFVAPWLRGQPVRHALIILALPHLVRHVSAMSLAAGVAVAETMPPQWAWSVSLGDLTAMLLALATIGALRAEARFALGLAWVFNVVGSLDILHVAFEAKRYEVVEHYGAQWYVPTMAMPVLVVSHVLIFATLIRRGRELR